MVERAVAHRRQRTPTRWHRRPSPHASSTHQRISTRTTSSRPGLRRPSRTAAGRAQLRGRDTGEMSDLCRGQRGARDVRVRPATAEPRALHHQADRTRRVSSRRAPSRLRGLHGIRGRGVSVVRVAPPPAHTFAQPGTPGTKPPTPQASTSAERAGRGGGPAGTGTCPECRNAHAL